MWQVAYKGSSADEVHIAQHIHPLAHIAYLQLLVYAAASDRRAYPATAVSHRHRALTATVPSPQGIKVSHSEGIVNMHIVGIVISLLIICMIGGSAHTGLLATLRSGEPW